MSSSRVQALPTEYLGYIFRSRLEARWAVFLTALEITWQYEAEGLDIDGTWYLPDFQLPELELLLEIKPYLGEHERPNHPVFDWQKRREGSALLIGDASYDFLLLRGEPWANFDEESSHNYGYDDPYEGFTYWDDHYYWCRCNCSSVGLAYCGKSDRICIDRRVKGGSTCQELFGRNLYRRNAPLIAAFKAARNERFGT